MPASTQRGPTVKITVNGQVREVAANITLAELIQQLDLRVEQVAVERNLEIVPRATFPSCKLQPEDNLEIVTLVGGGSVDTPARDVDLDQPLRLGSYTFSNRLFVGTGKYATFEQMRDCLEASGTDCVTVAVRRVNLTDRGKPSLLDFIDRRKVTILPNTAGCYSADDAIRYARLSREVLETDLVKLEVLADERTLLPDPLQTLLATERLVKEGFTVLCYTSDDPIMARRIEEAGATSVMPAGSPIGSGQGILNPNNLRIILENAKVPIICDAGVGTASDVAIAMELGCEGVLLNTGIAHAKDPLRMAHAMRHACAAGRLAYLAGRIPKRLYAAASSPTEGRIAAS
ncbi:MAG: sulfur carrier protein ThiS [Planctomycetota bacterium]